MIINFIDRTKRGAPARIRWLTADPELGVVNWLEVLELGPDASDARALPDLNLKPVPRRPRLGVQLGPLQDGGILISGVVRNSPASRAGMKANDVLVKFDGRDSPNPVVFGQLLNNKRSADPFSVTVKRGEDSVELKGQFPPFDPRPIYRRDKPTAFIDVLFQESRLLVTSRGVRRAKIWLPDLFAGRDSISVDFNGQLKSFEVQRLTPGEFLSRFAKTADRNMTQYAYIIIE